MDHPTRRSRSGEEAVGPIDGIVGFPFFARFKMTLDYQAKTMTFVPNGFEPPDVMQDIMAAVTEAASDEPKVLAPAGHWGMVAAKADDEEPA